MAFKGQPHVTYIYNRLQTTHITVILIRINRFFIEQLIFLLFHQVDPFLCTVEWPVLPMHIYVYLKIFPHNTLYKKTGNCVYTQTYLKNRNPVFFALQQTLTQPSADLDNTAVYWFLLLDFWNLYWLYWRRCDWYFRWIY